MIKKEGNKFLVKDSKGDKTLGTHKSRSKALKQLAAIEASKNEERDKKRSEYFKNGGKKNMKCNSPTRSEKADKKFKVKACQDGKEKLLHYGDANMRIKKSIPERRKAFRARHKCDTANDKLTRRYWSCKKW